MFQYDELIAAGFTGFKTVKQMNNGGLSSVTESQGVYMILYLNPTGEMPNFLPVGTGGLFKGEDPNVSIVELQNNWVRHSSRLYRQSNQYQETFVSIYEVWPGKECRP